MTSRTRLLWLGVMVVACSGAPTAPVAPSDPTKQVVGSAPNISRDAPASDVPATEPGAAESGASTTDRHSSSSGKRPRGRFLLPVPGHDDATVSFPDEAALPQPLVVVTHGAGNTPDSMCEVFRVVVGERAVLLCPAGPRVAKGEEGRYYPDHFKLEKIVLASVEALAAAYPDAVDTKNAVYSGYSQGATMGALMVPAHGDRFPRLALVEGGVEGWTLARAKQFEASGGKRVLFACGTPHCKKHAEAVGVLLRKADVDVAVVADTGAGHTYGGTVARAVHDAWDALVADDPRFSR